MNRAAVYVLGIVVALAFSCVMAKTPSPFYADGEDCTTLEVRNQHFSDVRVYWRAPRERIGIATGLMTTEFELCESPTRPAVFDIDAIGGAFHLTLRTNNRALTYDPTVLIITPNPYSSVVIGK